MDNSTYYYIKNGKSYGPFPADQLVKLINPDTPIWTSGMTEWKPARDVAHICDKLKAEASNTTPPPFHYNSNEPIPKTPKPKTEKWRAAAIGLFILLASAYLSIYICNQNTHNDRNSNSEGTETSTGEDSVIVSTVEEDDSTAAEEPSSETKPIATTESSSNNSGHSRQIQPVFKERWRNCTFCDPDRKGYCRNCNGQGSLDAGYSRMICSLCGGTGVCSSCGGRGETKEIYEDWE